MIATFCFEDSAHRSGRIPSRCGAAPQGSRSFGLQSVTLGFRLFGGCGVLFTSDCSAHQEDPCRISALDSRLPCLTRAKWFKEQYQSVSLVTAFVATRATRVLRRPSYRSHSKQVALEKATLQHFASSSRPTAYQTGEWNVAARKLPRRPRSGFRSHLTMSQAWTSLGHTPNVKGSCQTRLNTQVVLVKFCPRASRIRSPKDEHSETENVCIMYLHIVHTHTRT